MAGIGACIRGDTFVPLLVASARENAGFFHNTSGSMKHLVGCIIVLTIMAVWMSHELAAALKPATGRLRGSGVAAPDVVPQQVVVKFRSGSFVSGALAKPTEALDTVVARSRALAARQMFPRKPVLGKTAAQEDPVGIARICLLELRADQDPVTVARDLSRIAGVEYAEPKYFQHLCDTPNDSLFTSQAAMFARLDAVAGWTLGKGSSSVIIADVDGGTYWRHEDLLGNVHLNPGEDINHNGQFDAGDINGIDDDGNGFVDDVVGWNFANNSNDPSGLAATPGSYSHGTATASHYGAVTNNGKGMAGSSWNCQIMPICASSPTIDESISYGYEGIMYAVHNGASIINCSWGRLGGFSQFEQDVITAATKAGVLVVAAAGNDGANTDLSPHYPSNYAGVLAVGATNSTSDGIAYFSNYGTAVPVYAPGVSIISAFVGGGYGNGGSGTSYASPLVAGLAGILRAAHPSWTPEQTAAQIRSTADPIDAVNPTYTGSAGRGRVNFVRAQSESHAALDLVSSELRTTAGKTLFLPGDTLVLTLHLKNVLFATAVGCAVTVTSSDSALTVLDGSASVGSIGAGEETEVPPFKFRVGTLAATRQASVRATWTYNSTESDAAVFPAMLFPAMPLWLMQLNGASASLFSVCAVSRDVIWASGGDGAGTTPIVVVSTNGGDTWNDVTGTLQGVDLYCINALDAQRAWVGTADGRILATTNGGSAWTVQSYPGRQGGFIDAVKMFADGTGYALGDPPGDGRFVVLNTTNFGATWGHLPDEPGGLTTLEAGWNNSFWWTDPQHGWFGTNENRVWRTTDGGGTWSNASTGGANSYGVSFADASTGFAVHDGGTIARTTNGGQSWSVIASPTSTQVLGVACVSGTANAWVCTSDFPYHTRDAGATWNAEELYPFSGSITHIGFADSTRGWAVTSNGEVLSYTPLTTTGVGDQPVGEVPAAFGLEQNFPNPFNPTTKVGYSVGVVSGRSPVASDVRLSVYDILGREVAVLVDERKEPGAYAVAFNAGNLSSGVYFYRLQVSNPGNGNVVFRSTRKMLLTK